MKSLKYILFLLLIGFIGLSIYIAVQPNSFEVIRSKSVKAPTAVIQETLKDTTANDFSYFWKETETLKTTSKDSKDSIYQSFTSKAIPESELIWTFTSEGNGLTHVVRKLNVEKLSFITKAKNVLFGSMEKELADRFEKDLESLNVKVKSSMETYSVTVDGITEHGGGFYMYKTTSSTASNISNMMAKQYADLLNFIQSNSIQKNGMPFTIYNEMNNDGSVIMSNAIPVQNMVTVAEESNILCGYMERTRVLKTTLKGNYTNLKEAWETSFKYVKDNSLELSEQKPFEVHRNDPSDIPNPANWITELYIPLKPLESTETVPL